MDRICCGRRMEVRPQSTKPAMADWNEILSILKILLILSLFERKERREEAYGDAEGSGGDGGEQRYRRGDGGGAA
jgi:hypothetical protein